jgi:hypothetical protein
MVSVRRENVADRMYCPAKLPMAHRPKPCFHKPTKITSGLQEDLSFIVRQVPRAEQRWPVSPGAETGGWPIEPAKSTTDHLDPPKRTMYHADVQKTTTYNVLVLKSA